MNKKVKNKSFKIISVILISLLLIPTVLTFIEIPNTPKNVDGDLDPKLSVDPTITINSPTTNQLFGTTAPSFNVLIQNSNDTLWYTIDGGSTNITFNTNGTIDQTEWDGRSNGTVVITFYANTTIGEESLPTSVTVRKDVENPSITINSPTPGQFFDATAPSFNVEISDSSGVNLMWYTIDGGATNFTFGVNGTIDQTAWNGQGDGPVTIDFYANDTSSNEGTDQVIVNKDTGAPFITINSPTPGQVIGVTAPSFIVEIVDPELDTMWYTIDGGANNFTFVANGTIDQTAWNGQGEGPVTIDFYANDSSSNIGTSQVIITKDTGDPSVTINSPTPGQVIGVTAPNFDVEITDTNLDTMWYTIDGGATNFTFVANGTIDQINWIAQIDGSVTLIFYANDTAGNIGTSQVIITKDTSGPVITINSPTSSQAFGTNAPVFNVEITDPSGVNVMWYTIDNRITNVTFIVNDTIDQNNWTSHIDGSVTLIFYANDTLGNLGTSQVIISKDTLEPIITIDSPISNQTFTHDIPTFNISIIEGNLNMTWYTLDGGLTNITFTGLSGTINQLAWESAPNGTVTIRFYANDTFGNLGFNEVSVQFNKFTPKPFTLSSNAGSPDTDGQFDLNWTISIGADNYSIYMYSGFIIDINSSVILVASGLTVLSYSMFNESGIYYFLVRSYNMTGLTDSNQLNITVDIPPDAPEGVFDLMSFLTNPLTIVNFGIMIGLLAGIIVKVRKKYYKSGDKEIKRIEEIRRRKAEE